MPAKLLHCDRSYRGKSHRGESAGDGASSQRDVEAHDEPDEPELHDEPDEPELHEEPHEELEPPDAPVDELQDAADESPLEPPSSLHPPPSPGVPALEKSTSPSAPVGPPSSGIE